jgi:Alginate export
LIKIKYRCCGLRYSAGMDKLLLISISSALAALSAPAPALAQSAGEPITVNPYAEIRYRLELVDQEGVPENAAASTARIRAGFKTTEWHGLSVLIEGEAIARLGPRHYNDTVNGRTTYPVVADPSDILLNQAWVRFKPAQQVEAIVGRQAVNFDNQRWVGSVGWRQNDQTVDAARVSVKPISGVTVDYSYAWRVNRIFGPDSLQGIWRDNNIHLLRADYEVNPVGTLTAYGYFLELPDAVTLSSKTFGIRFSGDQKLSGNAKLLYRLEYANQRDLSPNPRSFSHDYLLIEPGITVGAVTMKLGLERLEGDGVTALQTPLATLHAFNGWADKFLSTPSNGLRDVYADISSKLPVIAGIKGATLRLQYHDYDSTRRDIAYGREWGGLVGAPINKWLVATMKFAHYSADRFATDTTKFWFALDAKF